MKKILFSLTLCSLMLHANETVSREKYQQLEQRVAELEKLLKVKSTVDKKTNIEKLSDENMKAAMTNSNSFNQKNFIPDISLILNGSAVSRNISNTEYEGYGIPGFVDSTEEIPFNKNRGFNFNYAEVAMHSEVGPYFDADVTFHLGADEFETEEAYITTKKLPYNLEVKAGTFKSNFGYINNIHQHAQHFVAQPLVHEAMFGVEGIKDPGISLHWVAPTDNYLMLGFEALQGTNELSFGNTDNDLLYIGYIKSGFDLSDNLTALAGTSIAKGKTEDVSLNMQDSTVYGADLTLKYILDSYSSLTWQSEYLYRDKNDEKQAGLYTQLLYEINRNWEVGTRYDAITKNLISEPDDLKKYSAIVQYKPFEFSKLRLQYTFDKSKSFGMGREDEHQIALEFIIEAGAHGAHAF